MSIAQQQAALSEIAETVSHGSGLVVGGLGLACIGANR